MAYVLALDIGDARIGIAWGDTKSRIASPCAVLPACEVVSLSKSFTDIIEEYQPELLVCGLPKSMDGHDTQQTQHVVDVAKQISGAAKIDVVFIDERLSSKQAKSILRQQGLNERQMRGKVDSVAASLFLETWLNSHED